MELQEFKPACRLTEADRSVDMKSLDRKLDRVLYLLVKKARKEHTWQMPQGGVEPEESLVEVYIDLFFKTQKPENGLQLTHLHSFGWCSKLCVMMHKL